MAEAWIDARLEPRLPPGTRIIKADATHILVSHEAIPDEADHVIIDMGAYVPVPNPDAPK